MTDESIPACLRPYKDVLKHPYKDCNDYPERPYRDILFSVNRRCYHLFDSAHAVDWSKVEEEYVVPLPPLPGRNVMQLMP